MLSVVLISGNVRFQDPVPSFPLPTYPVLLLHVLSLRISSPLPVYITEMPASYEGYVRTFFPRPVLLTAYYCHICLTFLLPEGSLHNPYPPDVLLSPALQNCRSYSPYPKSGNTIFCLFLDLHLRSSDLFSPAHLPAACLGSHRPAGNIQVFLLLRQEAVPSLQYLRSVPLAPFGHCQTHGSGAPAHNHPHIQGRRYSESAVRHR